MAILLRVTETPPREQTRFSYGLIGFYVSVGLSSLGGAVSGVGYFVLRGDGRFVLVWVGVMMMVAGLLGGIRFLKSARGEA